MPFVRNTLFDFLFREFKKIKEFSVKYGVINRHLLPPRIKIEKEAVRAFTQKLHRDAVDLYEFLKQQ